MTIIYQKLQSYDMAEYDQKIDNLLAQMQGVVGLERLYVASQAFLGRPYLGGACGEGELSEFDQSPLYRTDAFDCVTYVNMVLALCLSDDLQQFKQKILAVNYYKSNPSYLTRFHFMSVDWNVQNAMLGVVEDITYTVTDEHEQPLVKDATALIDKPSWLLYRSLEDLKLLEDIEERQAQLRLDELHQQAAFVHPVDNITPYIPLTALFDHEEPNMAVFDRLVPGSVLEIVRPNWDLTAQIGTCLNISHVGFAVQDQGRLMFRQASSVSRQVEDVPLIDYLKHCLHSPTVGGINVQMPSMLL